MLLVWLFCKYLFCIKWIMIHGKYIAVLCNQGSDSKAFFVKRCKAKRHIIKNQLKKRSDAKRRSFFNQKAKRLKAILASFWNLKAMQSDKKRFFLNSISIIQNWEPVLNRPFDFDFTRYFLFHGTFPKRLKFLVFNWGNELATLSWTFVGELVGMCK